MKNLLVAALVFVSVPAFAGKMKEIWSMTNESVLETLGFNEGVVSIEDYQFVQVEGADLAVETSVRANYLVAGRSVTFECLTTFVKTNDSYKVRGTKCN